MSTQTAENPVEATQEVVPAAEVDHDALYDVLRRLRRCGWAIVKHVEARSADVHRDLEPMRQALTAADELLFPKPLPEGPDEDAIALFARAVRPGDLLWAADDGWLTVRSVQEHEFNPDTHVHLNCVTKEFLPCAVGLPFTSVVAVLRDPAPEAGE